MATKNRAELFKKLQPHYLTEPIIQPVIIKIDTAKAGTHEGTTYFVDAAKTAPKVEVLFVNRFLGEPVITQGVSTVGFKLKSGGPATVNVQSNGQAPRGLSVGTIVHTNGGDYKITQINTDGSYVSVPYTGVSATYSDYSGDWKMTIAGMMTKDDIIIGAAIYINPRDVMTDGFDAGSYPLTGALRLLVSGFAATEDLGAIDQWDEVPSEWSTTLDSTEYDTDAPLAPTGCVLLTGTTSPAGTAAKTSALVAWVELDWTPVAHNDLTGYNVDIFEDTAKSKTAGSITDTDFVGIPAQMFIDASHNNCSWNGLTLKSRYWVRIQSVDAHNNHSDWLLVGSIDTTADGAVPALSSIWTELFRPNIIRVNWSFNSGIANTANVLSFQLERKEEGGAYARIAETPGGSFTDTGLNQTKKYLYRVRSTSRYSETYSPWLEMTTPVQPQGILDMDVQATALYNRLTEGGVLSGNLAKGCVTADKLYAGTLTTYLANVVNRMRGCTVKFIESSLNHVGWNPGNITLAKATYAGQDPSTTNATWDAVTFTIAAGTYAGALYTTNPYYAYVTYTVDAYGEPTSVGAVTIDTRYPTGQYDIVLAIITRNSAGHIAVEVVNATGTIINGDHITTGSISASQINVTSLSSISANIGTITTGFIGNLSGSYFDVTNGIIRLKGGKVSVDNGAIPSSALDATVQTAISNASTALKDAATANDAITSISSDSILSPGEKSSVILDYSNITSEQYGLDTQATSFLITAEKSPYDSAVLALKTYLEALTGWNTVPGSDVVIVGTAFRSKFANVYSTRQTLLNAIAAKAKTLADTAWNLANSKTTAAAVATTLTAYATKLDISTKITAADVQNAITNNVTTIDGAKITTGIIAAGRIQLTGINTNALNNDAGWTTNARADAAYLLASGKIAAADVQNAITNNVTTIDGAKITTGSINASLITTGTLSGIFISGVTIMASAILSAQSIGLAAGAGIRFDAGSLWATNGHLYWNSTLIA